MRRRGAMHCRSEGQQGEDGEGTNTNDVNDALDQQKVSKIGNFAGFVWLLSGGRCGPALLHAKFIESLPCCIWQSVTTPLST